MQPETAIDRLSLRSLFDALKLPETTGYRYLKTLDELLTGQSFWTYQKGDGSVDSDGITIINIYFELTRHHKIQFCKKQLIKELEKHGYKIDKNNGTNYRRNNTTGQNNEQSRTKNSDFYDSLFGL